jgi:DNA invertase Pin-like site-specific DNA recombinase
MPEENPPRVALYARVHTDEQMAEATLDTQAACLQKLCDRSGIPIVDVGESPS